MEVGRRKKRPTWVSVAGERKRKREWWGSGYLSFWVVVVVVVGQHGSSCGD